nr:MAG TPA: hypothetical protein [Caudoviricetes sp.]
MHCFNPRIVIIIVILYNKLYGLSTVWCKSF